MILPLLWLSTASATTLAVIPFDRGAAAGDWDGLGTALAGMLVTDLSDVPGIRLVERERIDAVLGEVALGEQGFIDPGTAVKLGKGLGADLLLLGTYSVVGGTFVLDARLVDPANGEVRQSANATGTIAKFADAEKALVQAVLEDLDIVLAEDARLRMVGRVPTTRLDALAAYGRGAALSREGKIEDARAAYRAALAADPAFALARTGVINLASRLDSLEAERLASRADERQTRLNGVLSGVPDERLRVGPKDKPIDTDRFVVRVYALQESGLDCDAYAELRHWLERHNWSPKYAHKEYQATWHAVFEQAAELGLVPTDDPGSARDIEYALSEPTGMFSSLGNYLYLFPSPVLDVPQSEDLLHTGLRCYGSAAFAGEIEGIRAEIEARNLGAQVYEADDDTLTLSERLELAAIELRTRATGLLDSDSQRVLAIIDAHPDTETRRTVQGAATDIRTADRLHYLDSSASLGLSIPEMSAAASTWTVGDAAWVDWTQPHCKSILERSMPAARGWTRFIEEEKAKGRDFPARSVAPYLRSMADVGCVRGVPARFATPDDLATWITAGHARVRADAPNDCDRYWASVPGDISAGTWGPDLDWDHAYAAMVSYYGSVVVGGCVAEPAVNP